MLSVMMIEQRRKATDMYIKGFQLSPVQPNIVQITAVVRDGGRRRGQDETSAPSLRQVKLSLAHPSTAHVTASHAVASYRRGMYRCIINSRIRGCMVQTANAHLSH